ncbi:hypothetical protein UFOVP1605_25 [uncultured Caudovirales phage]|uniref:Phage portal protein n=1 Tax=uncultured Caudovirales phage TaxID=2100421 RepID=A0A6J5STM4_9CAUD|nr:hypothetical protein UFOVP1605_25 [uncultured Caudovirales phage]
MGREHNKFPIKADVKPFFKRILKAIPFSNMFVPEIVSESKGIYLFGKTNMLPNNLMKWVLDSGTAKRAVSKRATYISADGFVEDGAANFKVNAVQTADKILTEIAGYQAYFKGFALHVKRSAEGIQIKTIPFQDIRKRLDGKFSYNPTYSALKFDQSKEQIICAFKGVKPLTEFELNEIQANGEIIYAYHKNADNPNYPIPDYYAGIEDIRTSSELQKFDFESVTNAFLPSAILTLVGNLDDSQKDESGRTEKDYFDETLEQFTGNVKNAEGKSGRMRLMVTTARTKEEIPSLQTFDAKAIVDASNTKRDIIDRAVCRLFGVNPALVGFADASILGNQQALANASKEMCNEVISDQQLITEIFAAIYPEIPNWDITSFTPISFIPDVILADLTPTERRALVGYDELPSLTTGESLLSERLGVGGTQSLVGILTDATLASEQKISALEILFGIPHDDAVKLVGGGTTTA